MSAEYIFQIKVYFTLLAVLILLSLVWFYFLQQYFNLLKNSDEKTYQELGRPDFKRARFPKELALLKHLFSEIDLGDTKSDIKEKIIKLWHDRLRYAFLLYSLLFIMTFSYIVFTTFL